jgi:hypothetical protein
MRAKRSAGKYRRVRLTDDYGIADAQIIATVAKGRGEGVKVQRI